MCVCVCVCLFVSQSYVVYINYVVLYATKRVCICVCIYVLLYVLPAFKLIYAYSCYYYTVLGVCFCYLPFCLSMNMVSNYLKNLNNIQLFCFM